jgi:hypothetical protein
MLRMAQLYWSITMSKIQLYRSTAMINYLKIAMNVAKELGINDRPYIEELTEILEYHSPTPEQFEQLVREDLIKEFGK